MSCTRGCFSGFGKKSQPVTRTLQFFIPRANAFSGVDGRQLYDLETQFAIQREFASAVKQRENALPFNHPPFEALLFAPLARLPYVAAYLVWALFNIALILGLWILLRPRLPSLHAFLPALPLLAMFAFFPVVIALLQGQDSILLLFLYGLAFSALATGRNFVAGVCLGLALFKFQLVLPFVLVLLVRRQWRAVAGFVVTAFGLLMVSAAVVGWSGVMAYPGFVLRLSRSGAQAGIDPRAMPNLRGLVAGSLHLAGLPATLLIIALSIALLALAAHWWREQAGRQFVLGFSLCLTVTIIASYHLLTHDLSLLILPILLLAELLVAGEIVGPCAPHPGRVHRGAVFDALVRGPSVLVAGDESDGVCRGHVCGGYRNRADPQKSRGACCITRDAGGLQPDNHEGHEGTRRKPLGLEPS